MILSKEKLHQTRQQQPKQTRPFHVPDSLLGTFPGGPSGTTKDSSRTGCQAGLTGSQWEKTNTWLTRQGAPTTCGHQDLTSEGTLQAWLPPTVILTSNRAPATGEMHYPSFMAPVGAPSPEGFEGGCRTSYIGQDNFPPGLPLPSFHFNMKWIWPKPFLLPHGASM